MIIVNKRAEEEGFEPPGNLSATSVFKTGALNRSAIPPISFWAHYAYLERDANMKYFFKKNEFFFHFF